MGQSEIWVIAETKNGRLTERTMEIIRDARKISASLGGELCLTGFEPFRKKPEDLSQNGVQKIRFITFSDSPAHKYDLVLRGLCKLVEEHEPKIIFFPSNAMGFHVAPQLAVHFNTGIASNVVEAKVINNILQAISSTFQDRAYSTLVFQGKGPHILMMARGDAIPPKGLPPRGIEHEEWQLDVETSGTDIRVVDIKPPDPEEIDIREAEKIVVAGFGSRDSRGMELIRQLAGALGASLGATRRLVDLNLLPYDRQIGQSGKTVSPRILISVGVSGSSHHTYGMKDSEVIIAVNKDKNARIFDFADLKVVADLNDVLPALVSELEKMKKEKENQ